MKEYAPRLVKYVVGDVHKEVEMQLAPGERKLVVVAHDEMTAQANDGKTMSWVWQGEQPLKKKGVERGLHQSDVICSTFAWLKDASQTLEYGKNYGMGNSLSNRSVSSLNILAKLNVLFIKLAEKIIPAFEKAHGPSYQALIMVDNSQGHSAYSMDALLTSRMNMRPGGKQANM